MQTSNSLHQQAVTLAKDYLRTEAKLLKVLVEIYKRRSYLPLGYRDLYDYSQRALKLSKAQSYYFSKVADKSQEVPALQKAVEAGELNISQARRIAPVVTVENVQEWISKATSLPQKDLELAVKKEHPEMAVRERVRPIAENRMELRCGISASFDNELARIRDIVSQMKRSPASIEDALEFMKEAFLDRHDPIRKAERSKQRSTRDEDTTPPLLRRAARVSTPIQTGRTPIPSAVKHSVRLRDGQRCAFKSLEGIRCEQSRWTEMHHRVPVSRGGQHSLSNITTLCSKHHRYLHGH